MTTATCSPNPQPSDLDVLKGLPMPHHDGTTRRKKQRKHAKHRMHKRTKAARLAAARTPKRRPDYATQERAGWDPAAAEAA